MTIYINYRYSHLAALLDHFLALHEIAREVILSKLDVILIKEFFCRVAEMASRCGINCNLRFCYWHINK